jgi:transcriptional regulator with XRE-family HTH domain
MQFSQYIFTKNAKKIKGRVIMLFMIKKKSNESFGQRLRQARRDKGLTQEQLAKLSEISRRAIVHYENHGRRPPIEKLKKLSEALGISANILIGVDDDTKSEHVSYNLLKRLKVIEELPLRDQKAIFRLINSLAEKNKLKQKKKTKKED